MRSTIRHADESIEVLAIGLSGQMHGVVMMDEQVRALAPAVIWPDQRSGQQVTEITDLIGLKKLIEITGSPVATGFQAATVRWFQQNEPDTWNRVEHLLLPKDYIRWRLTGDYATDPSDGSGTLLLDANKRYWSTELLDVADTPMTPSVLNSSRKFLPRWVSRCPDVSGPTMQWKPSACAWSSASAGDGSVPNMLATLDPSSLVE